MENLDKVEVPQSGTTRMIYNVKFWEHGQDLDHLKS